jgi:hypothetical protein
MWLLWLVALVASGIALLMGAPAGFYLLALASVSWLGLSVYNAWVLIAETAD